MFIDKQCYVAQLGDSRAIISRGGGSSWESLTNDHKPNFPSERERIINNGGSVYQ